MNIRSPLGRTVITDGEYQVTITGVIGFGGSCIVYEGEEYDGCRVIVKEYYPKALSLTRKGHNEELTVPKEKYEQFEAGKELFINGQENHKLIYNIYDGDGILPRPFKTVVYNNTIYSVSDLKGGYTLSEVFDRTDLTLYGIAKIMRQICNAVQKIHDCGLLYLDIKPDNFYYRKSDISNTNSIELFDFNTLVGIDEVQNNDYEFCSYSQSWAAPEQIDIDEYGRYKHPELISYSTDYYAIGEVFFYLLTRRQPKKEDFEEIALNAFDWKSELKCYASDSAIELISNIAHQTLNRDAKCRMATFSHEQETGSILRKWFDELSSKAVSKNDGVEFKAIDEKFEEASKKQSEIQSSVDKGFDELSQNVKNNSLKHFLFGNKKRKIISGLVALLIVAAIGVVTFLSSFFAGEFSNKRALNYENGFDNHLLLALSNANHQYEVGLENWRRMDYNRAERDIKTARDEISKSISQSTIDVAIINNSLGCLYLDMGRYQDAYDYLNNAYVTFKKEYGENSPESKSVLFSIAQYDYYVGDIDTAKETLQHITDNSDPKKDIVILATVNHLKAMIDESLGNYDAALSAYNEILNLYSEFLENNKLTKELVDYVNDSAMDKSDKEYFTNALKRIILTHNGIGEIYYKTGEYDKAQEVLENALDMSLNNIYIGIKNLITAKLYMNLAMVKSKNGNISNAKDDIDLSMRIEKNLFDFEGVYPGLVEVYDVYGDIEYDQGNLNVANKYYADALSLADSSFGEKHPISAEARNVIGIYCDKIGNTDEAIEYFISAIEIRKDILGVNSISTVNYYINLANSYLKIKEYDNAMDCVESAEKICDIIGANESVRDLVKNIKLSMRTVQTDE